MKFSSFSADFQFRAEVKKVTSRAELNFLQLELWLEPARLGLITSIQAWSKGGGQGGDRPPQILAGQKAPPAAAARRYYYVPPQIFRLWTMPGLFLEFVRLLMQFSFLVHTIHI